MQTTWNQRLTATASTIASAVAFGGATGAQAAPPPPPTVYSWTGWYAGLNLGGTEHHTNMHDVNGWGVGDGEGPYSTPFFSTKDTTFSFGAQGGYNKQFGNFVAGLEADITYAGTHGTAQTANTFNCGNNCFAPATSELTWMATFRGRAGFLVRENFLVFGTGGLAVAGIRNQWATLFTDETVSDTTQFKVDNVRTGFVYGGGIEYMFPNNWMVRGEVLHADFGTSTATITGNPPYESGFGTYSVTFKNSVNIGRVAFSYRW